MLKIIGSFSGHLIWVVIISFLTITIVLSPIMTFSQFVDTQQENNNSSIKVVILTFGNGPKSQYTEAKPILDKYGFKASFFVVCNWISDSNEDKDEDNSHMTWQDIETLYNEGHNIGAKSLNHKDLTTLSA
ncbi:MAG: polysaccharide deacetylase family protein, partial [Thermoproteota archaeon]|nr:polysaccharide deacetylase family protein [Thermoproteota archaeon]